VDGSHRRDPLGVQVQVRTQDPWYRQSHDTAGHDVQ